jgi:basic membrane protein A
MWNRTTEHFTGISMVSKAVLGAIAVVIILVAGVSGYLIYQNTVAPSQSSSGFKVAYYVVGGSAHDEGYNQACLDSLEVLASKLGFEWTYTDNVAVADEPRIVGSWASEGYDVIIPSGSSVLSQLALANPDTILMSWAGSQGGVGNASNAVVLNIWPHEGSYLAGILAAYMTETETVAVHLAFPYPQQNVALNGFKAGVASVNKNITVLQTFVYSWYDVSAGYEATKSLISQGADVIYFNEGGGPALGGLQAADENNIYAIGGAGADYWQWTDDHPEWQDVILTSVTWNFTACIEPYLKAAIAGTLVTGRAYDNTMKDGADDLAPFRGEFVTTIPETAKTAINTARSKILSGTLAVPLNPALT